MKTVLTRFLFLLAVLAAAANVQSQTLTFRDAVKIGLENNLNLRQQKNLLVSAKVSRTAGMLGLGPSVAINGNAGRNDGNRFIQQEAKVVNGVTDFVNASIDANMPLFQGLSALNTYKQTASQYEAQLNLVERTSEEVIRDVSRQYLNCLLDQQLVAINQKNVETQQKQYEQISEQVSAGSRAEVDLKNQEFQLRNAELLLLRAKNTLRNDKAILAQTLQMDPTQAFDVAEPAWALPDINSYQLDDLQLVAQSRRNDLERIKENEKAALQGMRATRGGYYPNISLFASYGSAYNYVYRNEVLVDVQNRPFREQFVTDNKQFTYGLSFRIPIYGGFLNRSLTARQKALYENAKLQTENTELLVKSEVQLAYQNLQDAQSAFTAAEAQLAAAETSYKFEQERYNLGISDIVALTLATQNYTRAQADYASARYTLLFQKLLVNFATGTLKPEDIE